MLEILHQVEQKLPELLKNLLDWNSVDVDYHDPRVERLWRQYDENRIMLHCIHPCKTEDALMHPHPWPSAMRILEGVYEMGVSYSDQRRVSPPIAAKINLVAGVDYEMTDPDGWHYVRPVNGRVYTIMVTGAPWNNDSPKSTKKLIALSDIRKRELADKFLSFYR